MSENSFLSIGAKMDLDESETSAKSKDLKKLDEMSIKALEEYIEDLQVEIRRVTGAINEKKIALEGAQKFFKN